MRSLAIIGMCICSAVIYGLLHDQIIARICVEYFTMGHAPVFDTEVHLAGSTFLFVISPRQFARGRLWWSRGTRFSASVAGIRRLFAPAFVIGSFISSFAAADDVVEKSEDRPPNIDVYKIAKHGDAIIIPVTVGGKDFPFYLSTASTRMVFDPRLRDYLGKSTNRFDDPITSGVYDEYPALPLKVGKLEFTPLMPVVCGDIGDLQPFFGHECYGEIGLDCFEGRVLQIDFDRGELRVTKSIPDGVVNEAVSKPLLKAGPYDPYSISLILPGDVGANPFVIDTLHPWSLAVQPVLMDALIKGGAIIDLQQAFAAKIGTPRTLRMGFLRSVSLSDWEHRKNPWEHTVLSIYEKPDTRVGLAYLSRFVLTFDLRDEKCL